tara:strand:+ start:324 stop:620 length:297 start_codon:yes stop_codon:yes gene_type:complete
MPDKYDMALDARPDISWKHQSNCPECGSENMSWIEVTWKDYKSIENEVYDNKYQDIPYCIDCFENSYRTTPFDKVVADEVDKVVDREIDNQIDASKGA